MAYNKPIFVLLLATALVSVANVSPITGNFSITFGSRRPGDQLVIQKDLSVPSKVMSIVTGSVTFIAPSNKNITQIAVYDQNSDRSGADVTYISDDGGRNVTLKFKSQRNHGIHVLVQVYAK